MKDWEGGMEERQREEGEEEGEPAPKGLSLPCRRAMEGASSGLPRTRSPAGESLQGHPQVSLPHPHPQVVERILVGVPPGTQHEAPLCLSLLVYPLPSRLLTITPYLVQAREGPR